MTDTERNLLHAICKTPADDDARMVYADYLDETDRPLRAEFVRLQVAVAKAVPVGQRTQEIKFDGGGYGAPVERIYLGPIWPDEYYQWSQRVFELLLNANTPEWFGAAWKGWLLDTTSWNRVRQSGQVHRGFVAEIALAWPDWKACHADLFWTPEAVCPHCHGSPVKISRWRIAEMDADDYGTSATFCQYCKTGKMPGDNPFRGTEQPLTRVTFTTWPDADISDVMDAETAAMAGWNTVGEAILGKIEKLWPGVKFVLPNPYAPGQPAWTPQIDDDGFDPVGDWYDDFGDDDA